MNSHGKPCQGDAASKWDNTDKRLGTELRFPVRSQRARLCALVQWDECAFAGNRAIHTESFARRHGSLVDITRCNSPEDAFECQRRFAEKATAGYAAEVTKLSHMMMSLASEGLESHQRGADAVS
jgi:hypothetical protein